MSCVQSLKVYHSSLTVILFIMFSVKLNLYTTFHPPCYLAVPWLRACLKFGYKLSNLPRYSTELRRKHLRFTALTDGEIGLRPCHDSLGETRNGTGFSFDSFCILNPRELFRVSNKDENALSSRRDCTACSWDVDNMASMVIGSERIKSLLKTKDCSIEREEGKV